MKNLSKLSLTLLLGLLLSWSCATTSGGASRQAVDYSNLQSLDQVLRMQPSIQVTGSGPGTKVVIRGISSFTLSSDPLYVIDGNPIGHSYSLADNAVNVRDITSVRVLAGKTETTIYGEEGNNGVIIIKTRASSN
jgi:outer membrane cobalamin receptor